MLHKYDSRLFSIHLTNFFLVVSNKPDNKNLIKLGNKRVVEARLADAKFFWDKDKSRNLIKQIGKLKNIKRPGYEEYGRRTNIWYYLVGKGHSSSDNFAFDHPAIFPEKLA